MFLTAKCQIKGLSVDEYQTLRLLCRLSKNIYNTALYNVRQFYFNERKYLRYESNYHLCKSSENYKLLGVDISCQTMKVVDRAFKSFFALVKKIKSGTSQFNRIGLPRYLDKDGFFSLILPTVHLTFHNGDFYLPMSAETKQKCGRIKFRVPPYIDCDSIKEIRIHPRNKARFFEIEFIYEREIVRSEIDTNKFLGVDLGVDNLATCVTSEGATFIVDGKSIKSFNRLYNKTNARLQSVHAKQGVKGYSRRRYLSLRKRNRRINHSMSVAARRIINFCIKNQIGTLVVGCNFGWKTNVNIGKINNQNFLMIPHGKLRSKLEYLCTLYSIRYVEQEESYTSKASFFDNDELPTYNADNPQEYRFNGKRISRGQYLTANGYSFNADVNGALNILRKSNLISLATLQASGCANQPQRIRIF